MSELNTVTISTEEYLNLVNYKEVVHNTSFYVCWYPVSPSGHRKIRSIKIDEVINTLMKQVEQLTVENKTLRHIYPKMYKPPGK